jgi:hypothetical protein
MRRPLLGLLAFLVLLICSSSLKSQTTLITGDIAFTGYNADTPDQFTFVIFSDVTVGTEITFTDNGWFAAGGFRSGEGMATLTFTSAATAGTEIKVEGTTVTTSNIATATVASNNIALAAGGDQLFAYQGAAPTTGFECNFLTGFHSNSGGGWEADATSSNSSALPGTFTDGVNAIALAPEVDNGFYNRTSVTGTSAVLSTAIYTASDWTTSNSTQTLTVADYTVNPGSGIITLPNAPTLAGTASICPGTDGMVNVTSGDLNDATSWVLYTGSCGGTEIERNGTGMFIVSPMVTTEYFVGGDGCLTGLGLCTSVIVNIDNVPPVLTIPGDLTVASTDATDVMATGMATATDDCATAPVVTPWINEIHYDNTGGDVGEGLEIAGPAGIDLAGWTVEAVNGSNGTVYRTINLSGVFTDNGAGYGTIFFGLPANGLQNGGSEGLALVDDTGTVIQFLGYEGAVTATAGAAAGMTATDIGVSEGGGTQVGESLQLEGTGGQYSEFTWGANAIANTENQTNTGQVFTAPTGGSVTIAFVDATTQGACAGNRTISRAFTATDSNNNQSTATQTIVIEDNEAPIIITPGDITLACTVTDFSPAATGGVATAYDPGVGFQPSITPFINEVHYDNGGTDMGEFIEIAGLANQSLADWSLVLYNGANGSIYNTVPVNGTFANPGSGFGFISISFPSNGIQNGAPDGIALVDAGGAVIEFISYEGAFTPAIGPAAGIMSTDIGVEESFMTDLGFSLQRTGAGATGTDFTWTGPAVESPGAVNAGQSSTVVGPIATSYTEDISADGRTITRTFSAVDDCGNMTVDGDYVQVIFIGDVAPRLECRQPTSTCNAPGLCGNDQLNLLPPFIFDDCGFGDAVTITSDQPAIFPIGTTVVTWTVSNSTGASQCESLVIISDEEAPVVECPSEGVVDIYTQNPNSCTAQISLNPSITDNCGVASVNGTGNFTFAPGLYNKPVTATDAAGNSTTCDYQIYVHDTFSPELTNCPDDLIVTSTGELTTVFLPQPSATDNCGGVEITNDAPEGGFPVGTTTVNFMIIDDYGNVVGCSYDVIVEANAPIVFSGLNDVEASLEEENTTARVAWNEPAANTNCTICAETAIENYRYIGVYRGHQYFLYEGGNTTWNEAEVMAEMLDAQLVTINTESENRFLKNALNTDFSSAFTGLTQTTNEEETVMNWLTTENVDFINFDTEYTPTATASLGVLQADGTWILVDNTVESAFLIERPCINFEQISPVLTETDEETGEVISETLLTCGSDFTEGTYVVTYRATDMCGNEAEINFDVVVEMPTATTCTTGGTESSVFIENVLMGEYEMATGDDAGFGDYTEEEMVLYAVIDEETEEFTPVAMNIAAGGANGTEELFYRVWLDKNHDGDFFDADEMLAETMTTNDWAFELPAFEENMDATRMRIMVAKHDYPEVCGEVAQGEAEDYTVSILQIIVRPDGDDDIRGDDNDAPIIIGGGNNNGGTGILDLFPNPAKERVSLNLKGFIGQNVELTVTNQLGQVVHYQKLADVQTSRTTLDVKAFATGIYGVSVLTEGGELETVKLIVK